MSEASVMLKLRRIPIAQGLKLTLGKSVIVLVRILTILSSEYIGFARLWV